MNELSVMTSATMTSIEIADLVESRHDKVKQSIERLADRNVIQIPPMGITEKINGLGVKTREIVDTFFETFRRFLLPFFQRLHRRKMPKGFLWNLLVINSHVTLQRFLQIVC